LRIVTALREADRAPMTLGGYRGAGMVANKGLNAAAEPMVRRMAITLKALQKPAPADPRCIAPPRPAKALSTFAISLKPFVTL
jgi:hypothetical protein